MTSTYDRTAGAVDTGAHPAASVVIATIGRPEQLAVSLAAHERLNPTTPPFEVLVVLDGDDPVSREVAQRHWRFPCVVIGEPHRGISAAKNLGVAHARADYLVFLNDDTRPTPDCLLAHLDAQRRHGPCIVLGHVGWDPEHEITPYMRWLAPAGHQFDFARLEPDAPIGWDPIWGAHLGMPRAWMLDEPFGADHTAAVLEDAEWAYRQTVLRGRPARNVPAALAWHDHRCDGPADFRRRTRHRCRQPPAHPSSPGAPVDAGRAPGRNRRRRNAARGLARPLAARDRVGSRLPLELRTGDHDA